MKVQQPTISMPYVQPTLNNTYVVTIPYRYKDIIVPDGYETNGADIPRIAWVWIPPFKPRYLPAVIVHDYLCSTKDYTKADKYFEEILISIENSKETRIMVSAVKLYTKYIRGKV